MKFIEIDDIAGQAFIVSLRKTGKRKLNLSQIDNYGKKVVNDLKSKGEKVCLLLSRESTRNFFYNSKYFIYDDLTNIVELKPYITEDDLIKRFCGYINYEILLAFRKEENTKILFEK